MKTSKVFITALTLALAAPLLQAKIITVDNNPGAVAMFDNLFDAYNDPDTVDKDIILIAGSPTSYTSGTFLDCYKSLHFVGNGYFLEENGIEGVNKFPSTAFINFREDTAGGKGDSSESSCLGISGRFSSEDSVTDLVIDKCKTSNQTWDFNGKVTITRSFNQANVYLDGIDSNISNSIVNNLYLRVQPTQATHCVITNSIETVALSKVSSTILQLTGTNKIEGLGDYDHCLNIGEPIIPAGLNNVTDSVQIADVFVLGESPDGYYQLQTDTPNPAAGSGQGGKDMGAFGDMNPYVLSGVPGIPRITFLSVEGVATDNTPLSFELKAQSFAE